MARNHYSIPLDVRKRRAPRRAARDVSRGAASRNYWASWSAPPWKNWRRAFPYVKGSQVVATDEQGDPLYEGCRPYPRFLSLSRKYLHELVAQQDTSSH